MWCRDVGTFLLVYEQVYMHVHISGWGGPPKAIFLVHSPSFIFKTRSNH